MNITLGSCRPATTLVAAIVQAAIMLSHPALAQNKKSSPVSIEASVSLEWDQTGACIPPLVMPLLNKMINALKVIKLLPVTTRHQGPDLTDVSAHGSVVFVDDNVARGVKLDYRIVDETMTYSPESPGPARAAL